MAASSFEVPKSGSSLIKKPDTFATHVSGGISYGSYQPLVGFAPGLAEPKRRVEKGHGRSALPNSENVHAKSARRRQRAANREPSGVWPAMRIARPIFRQDPGWTRFHKEYEGNVGSVGQVPTLARWCVEYVSRTELDTMLDKRYHEIANTKDNGRARRTAQGIVGQLEKFVHKQLSDSRQAELLELGEDLCLRNEGILTDFDAPSVEAIQAAGTPIASLWERGSFDIDKTEGFGSNSIGLVFSPEAERTFYKEREGMTEFMGSGLGLDISKMDSKWRPRITVLQTYLTVGEISGIVEPSMPLSMDLRPPQASFVNPKMV
jgi:hypothetical protein